MNLGVFLPALTHAALHNVTAVLVLNIHTFCTARTFMPHKPSSGLRKLSSDPRLLYCIFLLYIQCFLLLQKHNGFIMETKAFLILSIVISQYAASNQPVLGFYCVGMFAFKNGCLSF